MTTIMDFSNFVKIITTDHMIHMCVKTVKMATPSDAFSPLEVSFRLLLLTGAKLPRGDTHSVRGGR